MIKYHCDVCGMSVEGLTCGKCGEALQHNTIKSSEGNLVQVSECPAKCGRIKSPTCCGQDMRVQV